MKSLVADFSNIPVTTATIASLFSDIVDKNQKVAELEKANEIIRLKRGLFVVSPQESNQAISIELIANHIYAPSYVSMSSALRYYGLIPEAAYTTQSMTIKHSRSFSNSIGNFNYTHISKNIFHIGVTTIEDNGIYFLIATPEKALCDLIANTPGLNLRYIVEVRRYLEEDIRLDMDAFFNMDANIFKSYIDSNGKKSTSIQTLLKFYEHEQDI